MHRFADDIFAQHRPDPGAAIARAGIGRAARPFQLDVASLAIAVDHLAQQNGAAIAQGRGKAAELVPGIGLGQRIGALGHGVAGKERGAVGFGHVEAELGGERVVIGQQMRRLDRGRGDTGVKGVRQAGIGIVEGDMQGHGTEVGIRAAHVQFRRDGLRAGF